MTDNIKSLIERLEADPRQPLPDAEVLAMLNDGERAEYLFNLKRMLDAQRADYEAADKPLEPEAVASFRQARDLHLKSVKSRTAQKKTIEKNIGKLAERLRSHNDYLDHQWKTVWAMWDQLSDEDKAWFEPTVTKSDRALTNFPRHYAQPPVRAVLPNQIPARTAAQLKLLYRLMRS